MPTTTSETSSATTESSNASTWSIRGSRWISRAGTAPTVAVPSGTGSEPRLADRKSVVQGKSVDLGGGRIIKKKSLLLSVGDVLGRPEVVLQVGTSPTLAS